MGPRSQAHRLVDVLGPPESPVPSVSIGVHPWLNSFPSALIRLKPTPGVLPLQAQSPFDDFAPFC